MVSRSQLLEHGLTADEIDGRARRGRLHPIHRGVYAVGRPVVSRRGTILAALLACGPHAVVSHQTAGETWRLIPERSGPVHVTDAKQRRVPGIRTHRRELKPHDRTRRHGIPVTSILLTLIDLATSLTRPQLEEAISAADRQDHLRANRLPALLARCPRRPGVAALKAIAGPSFRRTDSPLERAFLRLIRAAALPLPLTQQWVNGYRVDFHWPDLGLVVEVDGLTYHRTADQQSRDRARDQAHTAAGLTQLRFSREQIRREPEQVAATLATVIARLDQAAA